MDSLLENFDTDWIVRDFEELDEKLPLVAQIIVKREIDFRQLEKEDPDPQVVESIIAIMKETLLCMSEMTLDEVEHAIDLVSIACELTCMNSEGLLEEKNGKYYLTKEGQGYADLIKELDIEKKQDKQS